MFFLTDLLLSDLTLWVDFASPSVAGQLMRVGGLCQPIEAAGNALITLPCYLTAGPTAAEMGSLIAQAGEPEAPFIQRFLSNPLLLPVGLLAVFYVTFLMPEKRRKAEEAKMLASIQKNDRVVTAGGLHAVVVSAPPDSDVVTLKIDEGGNTRVKINRSAIITVLANSPSAAKASGKDKSSTPSLKANSDRDSSK